MILPCDDQVELHNEEESSKEKEYFEIDENVSG